MSEVVLKFECPRCGKTRLEEVMTEVTNVDEIIMYKGNILLEYGDHSLEAGSVNGYQCMACGEHIANTEEELLDFLKEKV